MFWRAEFSSLNYNTRKSVHTAREGRKSSFLSHCACFEYTSITRTETKSFTIKSRSYLNESSYNHNQPSPGEVTPYRPTSSGNSSPRRNSQTDDLCSSRKTQTRQRKGPTNFNPFAKLGERLMKILLSGTYLVAAEGDGERPEMARLSVLESDHCVWFVTSKKAPLGRRQIEWMQTASRTIKKLEWIANRDAARGRDVSCASVYDLQICFCYTRIEKT